MTSNYKGIYVQRYSNGQIHNVQVAYLNGNSIPLNPDDYLERDVKPLMESLPDVGEYFKLQEQAKGK
jgi:hypothetical protein